MKRYNILWIFSDQHRGQAMSLSGDPNIQTPYMDALAKDGTYFEQTYSVCPLCAPFRASLYTGKYIHQHGVGSLHLPPDPSCIMVPEELQKNGYYTVHFGKWHLSGGAAPCHFVSPYFRRGWDEWMGWENSNDPFHTMYSVGNIPKKYYLNGYQTDAVTELALDWLEKRQQEKPWFLVLSIEPPHDPHIAPLKNMEEFLEKDIVWRDNVPENWKTEENENKLKNYYAQIRNLDENIGKIVEKLKAVGEYENTIILYFSDHGEFLGSFGRNEKMYPEEESSRIPFIVYHPEAAKRGQRVQDLVSSIDITPTTFALAGLPVPAYYQGKDLSSFILQGKGTGRDAVLIGCNARFLDGDLSYYYRAIRTSKYLYARAKLPQYNVMYDMITDPYQMENLFNIEEKYQLRECLEQRLREYLNDIDDHFLEDING